MCSAVDALALDEWWVMDVGLRLGEDGIADDTRTTNFIALPRCSRAGIDCERGKPIEFA